MMGDFHDYSVDSGVCIKQEPINETNIMMTSASVPIPRREPATEYRDYSFDLDNSLCSPIIDQTFSPTTGYWQSHYLNNEEALKSEALIHMDEDDIFQVDKADLIQALFAGPTLAELNANDENLMGDWNFDDLLLPTNDSRYTNLDTNSTYSFNIAANNNQYAAAATQSFTLYKDFDLGGGMLGFEASSRTPASALSPGSPASSGSSIVNSQTSPLRIHNSLPQPPKQSTLHDLLMRKDKSSPDGSLLGQSVPSNRNALHSPSNQKLARNSSRLSSSAPTHLGLEQLWQRREPRKHLLSTSSLAECGSTSSISTGGILSPELQDYSHDEYESDEDSDGQYADYSSDNNSDDEEDGPKTSKKEKYFWQYNIQSKGPKGQRLVMKSKMENPHVLNEVTDPVFSPDCSVRGIKHSGKARKGDGNDLTPNPRKLYNIGKELDKLGRIINDMTPVSELPFNVRPTSRKEKNKLASRACRLKKKAQHEANKIKLSGLEQEHKRYINTIAQLRQLVTLKGSESGAESRDELVRTIEKLTKSCMNRVVTEGKVAGHTTEYVNKVLDKLKGGASAVFSSSFTDDL